MPNTRALVASHFLVFVSGVVAGKFINQDELDMYRSAHESTASKFKRSARNVAYGMLALGILVIGARSATRK